MSAVIIGLLVGGPVGRFKGSAGRDGVSLEAESDAGRGDARENCQS